jgi:hypothetical protein
MVPLAIVAAIAAAAVTAVVVVVLLLHFDDIKKWFIDKFFSKGKIKKDDVAFMLNEKMSHGKYRVLTGVFNKKTGTVQEEMQRTEAKELDDTLEDAFDEEDLVLLQ